MADFLPLQRLLSAGRADTHPVAYSGQREHSFADLRRLAARWRAALARQPETAVALHLEDGFEFAAALLGAWHAGKTVCLPADDLPATRERIARLGMPRLDPQQAAADGDEAFAPLADDCGLLLFTSGSTGEPQTIAKTLRQLAAETVTLSQRWDRSLPANCRVEATVSHQHIYGLLFRVLWPLAAGRPFASNRHAFPESLLAALDGTPSLLIASPAHLKRLPRQLAWQTARPAAVFSSGGPLDEAGLQNCRETLGQAPYEVFGSTETGGIAWRRREADASDAWQALPGIEVRIDGESLALRSPHLADDGWHATCDRVRAQDGGFALLGRADRIVKLEEKRVSLDAVEDALLASGLFEALRALPLPGARDLLGVAAVPNAAGWSELARVGRRAFAAALLNGIKDSVIAEALPRHWRYGFRLPINAQGKITQATLLSWFEPSRPHAALLERSAEHAVLQVEAAASLPDFAGHFPGFPLLPGVTQLDWSVRFARELFELPPAFCGVDNLKFQRIIDPGAVVRLELRHDRERGCVSFGYVSGEHAHASGKLRFSEPAC
ncbi:4-coumarate--CoA ligase [Chromobacterium sp. ATCC 53434]|uniref:AMP-binding protein n=1 Tax=Chromobacterium sp. (strain ATCC 53434 / SC 14030) TaxID=2059672 RepID=UPI000C75EB68|nr:AMP-binding protein [Chromobacterium sp. ATCC 53434]AUH50896.1 4-coumarate--CoA ligase [Chromobacterium sp. ATCC 53434]